MKKFFKALAAFFFGESKETKRRNEAQRDMIRKAIAKKDSVHIVTPQKQRVLRMGSSPSLNYHRDQEYYRRQAKHEEQRDDSLATAIVLGAIISSDQSQEQSEQKQDEPAREEGGGGSFGGGGSTESWAPESGGTDNNDSPSFRPATRDSSLPSALKRGPQPCF